MIETPAHTMMCLICSQVVKTVKGDDAKQHFRRHTPQAYAKLKVEPRKICVENLKKSVREQTSCMSTFTKSDNNLIAAKLLTEWHIILALRGSLIPMGNLFSDVSSTWLSGFILVRKLTIHQLFSRVIRFNAVKMILPNS